jgi:L-lactate dehydrogenase complex protein LldG
MSARDDILARVRSALAEADRTPVPVPRGYRSRPRVEGIVELFIDRVTDYRAVVERCAADEVLDRITAALPSSAAVLLPPGLPWPVAGTVDDAFTAAELDRYDAVVTAASVAIAETGTIVLTHGPGEGRRALSLVPDLHVCVVRADQIVADVPAGIARLTPVGVQTWISGPSATSDIELSRVEGVHGPRTLHVIVVGAPGTTG